MDLSAHGVVVLIKNSENKYLLLEEKRELLQGAFAPPHGRCDSSDNTEEDTVIREVKEETNLDVHPVRKLITQPADTKIKTVSFWLAELEGGEVIPDQNEVASFGWFSIEEALALELYPGTRIFFEKLRSGKIKIDS